MTRKPRFPMMATSGQPVKSEVTHAQEPTSPPITRAQGNPRKLDAAHKHLDKMFAEAEGEQIDGRGFWGFIVLEISFENGEAKEIQASKTARDRAVGWRK